MRKETYIQWIIKLTNDKREKRNKMREDIELIKEKMQTRRDILEQVYLFKREIDGLLNKGFFRELLSFYSYVGSLDGIADWFTLYGKYLLELESGDKQADEDCTPCTSGKMRLIEKMVFDLEETKLFEIIDRLAKLKEKHMEIIEREIILPADK